MLITHYCTSPFVEHSDQAVFNFLDFMIGKFALIAVEFYMLSVNNIESKITYLPIITDSNNYLQHDWFCGM